MVPWLLKTEVTPALRLATVHDAEAAREVRCLAVSHEQLVTFLDALRLDCCRLHAWIAERDHRLSDPSPVALGALETMHRTRRTQIGSNVDFDNAV